MRYLVDEAVSWQVARDLKVAGHDAVHVRDIGLSRTADSVILERAATEGRVVITQDTDYGTMLAVANLELPSVILLRMRDGRPEVQTRVLLNQMHKFEEDLERGAIVVIGDNQIRIRRLPIV